MGPEVLHDDGCLLADHLRVLPDESADGGAGLAHLDLGVAVHGGEPEVGAVGGVVGQHVEDELLLDGLAHRVEVERALRAVGSHNAEQLDRALLGGGREGEEAEVRLSASGGHDGGKRGFGVHLLVVAGQIAGSCSEGLLESGGGIPRLRAVGLVHDDREPLAREVDVIELRDDVGKRFQRDCDDLGFAPERGGELLGLRALPFLDGDDGPGDGLELGHRGP